MLCTSTRNLLLVMYWLLMEFPIVGTCLILENNWALPRNKVSWVPGCDLWWQVKHINHLHLLFWCLFQHEYEVCIHCTSWRVYNESWSYCWCFDYIKWMISLKSSRSWNCKSQGQKSWVYGGCLAFNSFSFLIPLGRFAPCDSHAVLSPIDS